MLHLTYSPTLLITSIAHANFLSYKDTVLYPSEAKLRQLQILSMKKGVRKRTLTRKVVHVYAVYLAESVCK